MSSELEATVEEESRAAWAQKNEQVKQDNTALNLHGDDDTPSDQAEGPEDTDIEYDDTDHTPLNFE